MKIRNIVLSLTGAIGTVVALKLVTRAKTVEWDAAVDRNPHSVNSRFISVDGARVHFQEFGDQAEPTLILIHGYTASAYVWNTSAPILAENGFHVIAVDLLGFGYSQKPASFDYSIASQARVIARFMNRLCIGRATLVGSSYGGAVAASVALDYPERVEKLVLADAVINDDLLSHLNPVSRRGHHAVSRQLEGVYAPPNAHCVGPRKSLFDHRRTY
ncbi:MAG: alpha/beta hydrolase [Acidobacteria bacterium]|nr:alpha/beta hydrolase [Acidobacteriota bacterium]